jgi:hypothetical protein
MILDPCHCQPVDVPNGEQIARGLFYSFHVKRNGALKWQAFRPDVGESNISVMRLPFLSANDCKAKAKQMETDEKKFRGFALFEVQTLRSGGFDVIDSRIIFCGHADLLIGVPNNPQEYDEPPTDQSDNLGLSDVCRQLMQLACVRSDPQSEAPEWPQSVPWLPIDEYGMSR